MYLYLYHQLMLFLFVLRLIICSLQMRLPTFCRTIRQRALRYYILHDHYPNVVLPAFCFLTASESPDTTIFIHSTEIIKTFHLRFQLVSFIDTTHPSRCWCVCFQVNRRKYSFQTVCKISPHIAD